MEETLDKGWLSGLYWKGKYDELLAEYQRLVHNYEELKREVGTGHRDNKRPLPYLLGGNKESSDG